MHAGLAHRFSRFAVVGASGLVVNTIVLWVATEIGGLHYLASAVVATQCSSLWNYVLTDGWVFHGGRRGRIRRFVFFMLMNNAWLAVRGPFLVLLTDGVGINYVLSNLTVLCAATLVRFGIADSLIWGRGDVHATAEQGDRSKKAVEPGSDLPFTYDIHGIIRVASQIVLPELSFFRRDASTGPPDIVVRVSREGFGGPRLSAGVKEQDHLISYVEHLGRWGFGVRIRSTDVIDVAVTPTVARSPHVLYTNVVEPLLRWTIVPRGYALVHAACLEIDGQGTLITAQTDTGKTTTCLMSVHHDGTGFVSDDMVIIDPHRNALAFPKPLTISAHTLRAARTNRLSLGRRVWLQVQSRLHSRSGRRAGLAMSKVSLPVCTLNAWVQRLIPPPKFPIQELIPEARIVASTTITHMGVIERGSTLVQPLFDLEANVEVLRANTEDAYGFPPYPLIARALANGHAAAEQELRHTLLDGLAVTRIRTSDRHWYEQLRLVTTEAPFALHVERLQPPAADEVVMLPDVVLGGGAGG